MSRAAQQSCSKLGATDLKCPKSDALIQDSNFPAQGLHTTCLQNFSSNDPPQNL